METEIDQTQMKNNNNNNKKKKPRILCLHGFRTSGEILKKQMGRWPEMVLGRLDLVFLDGPCPKKKGPMLKASSILLTTNGSSSARSSLPPFSTNSDFQEYYNFEECLAYIEDYMIKHGPFDGLLGFSQGVIISTALPGMQLDGVALTKVPKIKFLIIMSGAKLGGSKLISGGRFEGSKFGLPKIATSAFSSTVKCPSLHIIDEADFLKETGIELLESFEEPVVIDHPKGHTIARLDEKGLKTMLNFIEKIKEIQFQQE
ncbi:Esterase CG5412 [Camellia lanceoleosa]|uniref:Esterase CG5412 n=1 Tax=Camellia lanceoleosa TaxID=1840588 RepID=A0ACC0IY06_9ERIC|nr:Esterase CG5412 [Camellia lanceoleosa]